MKKLVSLIIAGSLILLSQAQNPKLQFIDSINNTINANKIILLFAEIRDTMDDDTGHKYTQRNSYYFDWVHKELRFIDVYRFDTIQKKHAAERAFRKQKEIPSGTRILYTFFVNKLVKVKVTPSNKQCVQCFGEYFFFNDELISKNEVNFTEQEINFVKHATFFLTRLQIEKKSDELLANK